MAGVACRAAEALWSHPQSRALSRACLLHPFVKGIATGDLPEGSAWSHDGPVFMILNLAVGGNYLEDPDETTEFPASVEVDWVRVYERATPYPVDTGAVE